MNLLLIRHGIAESRENNKPDKERQLTDKGRRQLSRHARYLVDFLADKTVQLISSPLVRSQQTAEVFTEKGLGQYIVKDFAATGNFKELEDEVKKKNAEIMVVVGHSPHLEEWTYRLTGHWLKLKKGAVISIEILDFQEITGKILWSYPLKQYNEMKNITENQDSKTEFRQDIEEKINDYLSMIKKHRVKYLENPDQIETIHGLRVKIRQFRSFVSVIKPLMSRADQKKVQKILRGLARNYAYLRELDVLIETWQGYESEFIEYGLTGQEFLKVLKMERQVEAARLVEVLDGPEFLKTLGRLQEKLKKAIKVKHATYKSLDDMVKEMLEQWHTKLKNHYDAISTHEPKVIHALRIQAKKIRYLMDTFKLKEDAVECEIHEDLKNWQDVLGKITDANRNIRVVEELAAKHSNQAIENEIDLFVALEHRRGEHYYEKFFAKNFFKEM